MNSFCLFMSKSFKATKATMYSSMSSTDIYIHSLNGSNSCSFDKTLDEMCLRIKMCVCVVPPTWSCFLHGFWWFPLPSTSLCIPPHAWGLPWGLFFRAQGTVTDRRELRTQFVQTLFAQHCLQTLVFFRISNLIISLHDVIWLQFSFTWWLQACLF